MLPKTTFEKISHHINSCPSHLGASAAAAAWRQKSTLTGRIPPLNGPFRCRPISHHFRVEEQVSQRKPPSSSSLSFKATSKIGTLEKTTDSICPIAWILARVSLRKNWPLQQITQDAHSKFTLNFKFKVIDYFISLL